MILALGQLAGQANYTQSSIHLITDHERIDYAQMGCK
jgi:hypothetical protein